MKIAKGKKNQQTMRKKTKRQKCRRYRQGIRGFITQTEPIEKIAKTSCDLGVRMEDYTDTGLMAERTDSPKNQSR